MKENWIHPVIEEGNLTKWNWMVRHKNNLVLGKNTDIGAFTYIQAKNGVIIEDDVQIGSHVSIYSENTIDGTQGKVVIKKGCKIGAHTVIMPNVTIGENAVVGAFSLVKEDILAQSLAYGIPAKVVKSF